MPNWKYLSDAQEKFALLVGLENKTYAEAAIIAYPQMQPKAQLKNSWIMAKIADSEEREEFWSDLMRDGSERTRDRLAASELLGKRQRDFVQQVETQTLTATVDLSQFSLQDLKDILAVVKERRMLDDGTDTTE